MSAAQTQRSPHGVPILALIAAGLMIAFAISAALYSKSSGVGRVSLQGATPYQVLQLRFEDRADGAVEVRDASRGDVLYVVEPGVGGFMRATLRTMAQARKRDDIGAGTPFRLVRWTDGALSIDDPTTGRTVGLDVFGPDNAGAFAQLFKKREEIK